MNRVANADEFVRCVRRINSEYQQAYSRQIESLRARLDAANGRHILDSALEEHQREYVRSRAANGTAMVQRMRQGTAARRDQS